MMYFSMAIKCSLIEEIEEALDELLKAVKEFIRMYCVTFHTDFLIGSVVKADWGRYTKCNRISNWFCCEH